MMEIRTLKSYGSIDVGGRTLRKAPGVIVCLKLVGCDLIGVRTHKVKMYHFIRKCNPDLF